MTESFRHRIAQASRDKGSSIILALDPQERPDLREYVYRVIDKLHNHICAVKINFHLILPFSFSDLRELNEVIHNHQLQSIADIKLNDIGETDDIAISYLSKMGFDAVIVNPFIGKNELLSIVKKTHELNCGTIALVYMSHEGANEGYGALVKRGTSPSDTGFVPMYNLFLELAHSCNVDGIVVGATQPKILRQISAEKKVPIYSPGIGKQGGTIADAAENGTDYFIIGRSILESNDPLQEILSILRTIS